MTNAMGDPVATFASVRRTRYASFRLQDEPGVDLSDLLFRGRISLQVSTQIVALSALTRQSIVISISDFQTLARIPSDQWIAADHDEVACLGILAASGLIVTDSIGDQLAELRRRDLQLSEQQWHPEAATYHAATRWSNVTRVKMFPDQPECLANPDDAAKAAVYKRFLDSFGSPPSHFHRVESAVQRISLPIAPRAGGLYDALIRRKTTRVFDTHRVLPLEQLATVLYYTYGCHGYFPAHPPTCIGLKRTSPSGGGLHPIEVYPLLLNVENTDPGIYHYNVQEHSLELMKQLDKTTARRLADEFTACQQYPQWAHALFILSARFYRTFWKYREHSKAYQVLYMDAAHLSQTFYLVCTDLGLGAFFTAAINDQNIEETLKLDSTSEGVLAISGCGIPLEHNILDPTFLPYTPG